MKKLIAIALTVILLVIGLGAVGVLSANSDDDLIRVGKYVCPCDATIDVPIGEEITWTMAITVRALTVDLKDVVVTDRFGGEFAVKEVIGPPWATLTTKGASDKVFLTWEVGDLAAHQEATLALRVCTDTNPAGQQEFTDYGTYYLNSGATAKGLVYEPEKKKPFQVSFVSNPIVITTVMPPDGG